MLIVIFESFQIILLIYIMSFSRKSILNISIKLFYSILLAYSCIL